MTEHQSYIDSMQFNIITLRMLMWFILPMTTLSLVFTFCGWLKAARFMIACMVVVGVVYAGVCAFHLFSVIKYISHP